MTAPDAVPLRYEHRPGGVSSDAPAVVVLHGRGTDERDPLPIGARLPDVLDDLDVLGVRAPEPMKMPDSYTWYELDLTDGLHDSQPDPDGFRRGLDRRSAFVDGAVDASDIDADRVGLHRPGAPNTPRTDSPRPAPTSGSSATGSATAPRPRRSRTSSPGWRTVTERPLRRSPSRRCRSARDSAPTREGWKPIRPHSGHRISYRHLLRRRSRCRTHSPANC